MSGKRDIILCSARKGSDVGAPKGNDILQVITRGPRENHQIEEELHPQALVYRNLWLEAEAPMCALSMEF
ncbi:hypothetical protein FCV25MIE_17349 [Fagus crenata]